jgi:putative ABC transport system ATP-binding protein
VGSTGGYPAVECEGVSKMFQAAGVAVRVLSAVSFNLDTGEALSVLGPSGSGKTTLLEIVGTLCRPSQGTVRLFGRDLDTMRDAEMTRLRNRSIGFVFQDFCLAEDWSVLHNVILPLQYDRKWKPGEALERVVEVTEAVGMLHRLRFPAYKLSGGEKQRVAIARAVVNRPKLVLADEPTGNLDPHNSDSVLDLLSGLVGQGTALIVVTHDAKVAERFGSRLEICDGGTRWVKDGAKPLASSREAIGAEGWVYRQQQNVAK